MKPCFDKWLASGTELTYEEWLSNYVADLEQLRAMIQAHYDTLKEYEAERNQLQAKLETARKAITDAIGDLQRGLDGQSVKYDLKRALAAIDAPQTEYAKVYQTAFDKFAGKGGK